MITYLSVDAVRVFPPGLPRWGYGKHIPDSKIQGVNMGPTWVLSARGGSHVSPMNLAIMDMLWLPKCQRRNLQKYGRMDHTNSEDRICNHKKNNPNKTMCTFDRIYQSYEEKRACIGALLTGLILNMLYISRIMHFVRDLLCFGSKVSTTIYLHRPIPPGMLPWLRIKSLFVSSSQLML